MPNFRTVKRRVKAKVQSPAQPVGAANAPNLEEYLQAAFEVYTDKEKAEKRGGERKVIEEFYNKEDPFEQITAIQNYLSSSKYRRGFTEGSYFADCINAAIYLYQCDYFTWQKREREENAFTPDEIIRAFDSLQFRGGAVFRKYETALYEKALKQQNEDNFKPIVIDSILSEDFAKALRKARESFISSENVRQDVKHYQYTLGDYYLFALEEYSNDAQYLSENRIKDIGNLRSIISKNFDDENNLRAEVKNYFAGDKFHRGISSRLEKSFAQADKDFKDAKRKPQQKKGVQSKNANYVERDVTTRTWLPDVQNEESKKNRVVVLAIHGWQDSVDTWEGIAPDLAKQGIEVIAYDQARHAHDSLRAGNPKLDLRQMRYDLYYKIRELRSDPTVAEIHLLGHSLGGAELANSMRTIFRRTKKKDSDETYNKVKTTVCISPGMMEDPIGGIRHMIPSMFSSDKGDRGPAALRIHKKGLSRRGGGSIKFRLYEFISFLVKSFQNLNNLRTRKRKEGDPAVLVLAGKSDRLVSVGNAQMLMFGKPPENPVLTVETIVKGTHHPHALGSPTQGRVFQRVFDFIYENSPVLKKRYPRKDIEARNTIQLPT